MKSFKYMVAVLGLAAALTINASACVVTDIGGVPFKGAGNPDGNNDPQSNFNALTLFLAANPGSSVGTPIFMGNDQTPSFSGTSSIDLTGYCYAVVHYGAGRGGSPGGSLEFFSITEAPGSCDYTFPQNGVGNGGFGGISSVRLFTCEHPNVPDGGASVMLLGTALTGLGMMRRMIKR